MARLPSFKKMFKGDYPEEFQDIVERMSDTINDGISSLYDALNKRLNFNDNFSGTDKEFVVEVASNGIPKQRTQIKLNSTLRIQGLLILRAESTNIQGIYPTAMPFITYEQSNDILIINNIKGLPADVKFTFRVFALQG